LTLAGVEQASRRFPEPIAVDYLSRLERGTLMPSVPKLATLANVYERPPQEFVDLYELEHLKALVPKQEGDFWHFRKLGIAYGTEGDHKRSAAAMLRGLEAARASGDIDAIAQALTSVGLGLHRLGRHNAALRFHEESLRIVREDRIRGYALWGVAQAYFHLHNIVLAECLADKALSLTRPGEPLRTFIRDLQSGILATQERYADAAVLTGEVLQEYEGLGDPQNATLAMFNLGSDLVRSGKVEEGLKVGREAMSRAAELGDPRLRAQAAFFYGRSLYEVGRYEDAAAPLKSAYLVARDREISKSAFHAVFYLWKLSDERGLQIEGDWLDLARRYRTMVEERSREVAEFDAWLALERKKPGPGRKSIDVM